MSRRTFRWLFAILSSIVGISDAHAQTASGNPYFSTLRIQGQTALGTWATGGEPGSPAGGWLGYNTTTNQPVYWNGSAWVALASGGGTGNVSNSGTPTGGQTPQWVDSTHIQGIGNTGSGLYVLQTAPVLTTPNLGTPSVAILTNATGTAAGLTAGTIIGQVPSATVDTTNAANISTGTLAAARLPPLNDEFCYNGDSLTSEVAATSTITLPWTSGTITKLVGQTSGSSASFSAAVQIGTTPVTGCTSLIVNNTLPTTATCTAANTWSSINQPVSIVVGAPTNTPTAWSVCAIAQHSPT